MRRLGYFIHKTSSGRLLVKLVSTKPPKLGSKVTNSRGELVGTVIDVIGPVRSPYAVVKLSRQDAVVREFEELFIR